jgi:hypothetical protein
LLLARTQIPISEFVAHFSPSSTTPRYHQYNKMSHGWRSSMLAVEDQAVLPPAGLSAVDTQTAAAAAVGRSTSEASFSFGGGGAASTTGGAASDSTSALPADQRSVLTSSVVEDTAKTGTVSTKSFINQLSVQIFPDRTFFLSGSTLSGHLELKSTANPRHLAIRSIVLEFVGREQAGSGEQDVLRQKLVIQSPELPPCDAVLVGADLCTPGKSSDTDSEGYWCAKKGTTRLQFAFELPATLPSTIANKYGTVSYSLIA